MSLFGILSKTREAALLLLLAAASAFATAPAPAADLSPAETSQLITRLHEHRAKYPSLTADFTEEKTSHLLQKPLQSSGTLAFESPNKFRRELKGNTPSLMVSNGQKLWIYYPNFKEAELYLLGKRAFFDDAIEALTAGLNFEHVSDYYRYTASKEDKGYRLNLVPKSPGLKRILKTLTVWVDDNYRVVRTDAALPKGDRVITSYRNQKPAAVSASTFDYTPPKDAKVSQPLGK